MRYRCLLPSLIIATILLLHSPRALGQGGSGTVVGTVRDSAKSPLQGAIVRLLPSGQKVTTDIQGQFRIADVSPGDYTLSVSYIGFGVSNTSVIVSTGETATANPVLELESQRDQVFVTAERASGEAEAINEIRANDIIVNILPSTVIRSLPNANVADAVGRLPGVTLERDEGEGKYVQIRGTEPRLSNLTVDNVIIPSPEGGVRQVKLDTIPADIVQSVQINKTLQANMDADAIGGTVNLVTKTAAELPTLTLYGAGGFTPIINTVPVTEFSGTYGQRFGRTKRLGLIFTGTYDYNGRGIDDIEPAPQGTLDPLATTATAAPSFIAIRQYQYDRTRYGFGGSLDYKLGEASLIYVKGLFSDFMDNGYRWEYQLTPASVAYVPATSTTPATTMPVPAAPPAFTTEKRDGNYQIASLLVGGNHVFTKSWVNWGVSTSQSRMLNPLNGGESITTFSGINGGNCQYDPAATKNKFLPQFTQACYTEAYDPNNFQLTSISDSAHGRSEQLNLALFASAARLYHLGSHPSTFEFGFKILNQHKFDDSYTLDYGPGPNAAPISMNGFVTNFKNPNYYGGAYQFGPAVSWSQVNSYFAAHSGDFVSLPTTSIGGNPNNFDLIERITSGYIMNTVDLGRFRIVAGLRIEGTLDNTTSWDFTANNGAGSLTKKGGGSYVSILPSALLRYRLDDSSDLKVIYSRALSRPDPQTLTTSYSVDVSTTPPTINEGNNSLTPEYSNNYDILYEKYLKPLGLLQAGFFYKQLSNTIVTDLSQGTATTCPSPYNQTPPFCLISAPVNAGSGWVTGFELSFQQHFTRLPGLLNGLGVSANYAYAASQQHNVNPGNRTDSPALLRQAPNTWNISPTYDHGRLSIRVGLAYNGANIFSYFYTDPNSCGPSNLPSGSLKGPCGDQYLFPHFQVDAQGSFRIRRGLNFIVAGLNLNNEVFGFYQGSQQYFIQREYYKPTFTFGFRWEPFTPKE